MRLTILITGANSGIGLSLTRHYLLKQHRVFAVCRASSPELEQLSANQECKIIENVDITQSDSIAKLATRLNGEKVDIVINNAGVLFNETIDEMNFDNINQQFNVNAVGAIKITQGLMASLNSNAKVALITSRMGSISDNGSGGYYGYRMSKAALNAAGKSLAIDLKPKGISVGIIHPGFVQTRMVGFAGDISSDEASNRIAQRIDELNLNNSGTFWHSNGEVLPW